MTEYTQMFEYAREMAKSLIDTEIGRKADEIFDTNSWWISFFQINFAQLRFEEVRLAMDKLLNADDSEGHPYSTAVARVRIKFIEMNAACGHDVVSKMTENVVKGLCSLNEETYSVHSPYAMTFKKHPELLLSVLGNQYFTSCRLKYEAKRALADRMKSNSER